MNNQIVSTKLGTIIIVIFTITAGMFVLVAERNNRPVIEKPQRITITNNKQPQKNNSAAGTISGEKYKNENYGFVLTLPENWIASNDSIYSKDNKYRITFRKLNLNEITNSDVIELYKKNNLKEAEQKQALNMCKETDACGKIVSWKDTSIENGIGAEFVIRYPGIRIDEPRGYTNEFHKTLKIDNAVYQFWTSEINPPSELKKDYPILSPLPSELLTQIMSSFETILY